MRPRVEFREKCVLPAEVWKGSTVGPPSTVVTLVCPAPAGVYWTFGITRSSYWTLPSNAAMPTYHVPGPSATPSSS